MKKIRQLILVGCLGLLGIGSPAIAGDLCGAVMCLSVNTSSPWQCGDSVNAYFNIRVYYGKNHNFDPGATSIRRHAEVMNRCTEAEQMDKDKVNAMYGMFEYYPFGFY